MPRDNFSSKTIEQLAKSVGYQCVRPGCAQITHFYDTLTGSMKSAARASHDSAASGGGPRYDASLTTEQRKSYENGAHLCVKCAVIVDIDVERFPPGIISGWQRKAVEIRNQLMRSTSPLQGINMREAFSATELFIKKCNSFMIDYYESCIRIKDLNSLHDFLRECYGYRPSHDFYGQYPHIVNKQLQIINTLESISKLFFQRDIRLVWNDRDNYRRYLSQPIRFPRRDDEIAINEILKKNIELLKLRYDDYCNYLRELKDIVYNKLTPINLMEW
ncbi:hypothetical protein [Acinetobacter terrestris]|uniref:hypothetical protein n=1 Tax=Acinetobacter terrestris TaxID=2529843 RepID=UPI00103E8C6D|nr:hypothetical protein [Acinetobacter terrestris]TCB54469.1 hypothetical protein E0H84_09315 [Acinetobacter terrestris]